MGWQSGGKRVSDAASRASEAADYIEGKEDLINKFTGEQENLQAQVDKLVVEGDSSPAAAQAAVGADGTKHSTLKARLDAEQNKVAQQLAETIELIGIPVEHRAFNETSDDGCIARAIEKAKSVYPFGKVIFDAKTYEITTPILHDIDGLYASLEGKGIRSTIIKAISPMPYLVKLSQPTGNHARKSVKGIHFFGNGLAECGIDASYLRYATIEENEFTGIAPNGYAIKCGNWVMRVKNNIINGLSIDGKTRSSNGIFVTQTTINNLLLLENSITSCKIGLTVNSAPHDIVIEGNTFDSCEETAILFKLSGRHISIKRNYFENCGKAGVQVEKSSGVFETWYGAIVAHPVYTVLSELFEQLNIEDNEFANCSTESYITLSNVSGLKISDNHCLGGYSATQFVNFRWLGLPYTGARRAEINHNNTGAIFTNVVGFNTNDSRLYQSGLVVRGSKSFARDETVKRGFESKNLSAWNTIGTPWDITEEEPFESLFKVYKVVGLPNTNIKRLLITLDSTYSQLKGRYLRFNSLSKGITGLPNGLWLQVRIDGVSVLDVNSNTETWNNGFRSATVLIPETATTLQIDLRPTYSNRDFYFTKFNICDASKEPHEVNFMTIDL